jgi:hypothetical protein
VKILDITQDNFYEIKAGASKTARVISRDIDIYYWYVIDKWEIHRLAIYSVNANHRFGYCIGKTFPDIISIYGQPYFVSDDVIKYAGTDYYIEFYGSWTSVAHIVIGKNL